MTMTLMTMSMVSMGGFSLSRPVPAVDVWTLWGRLAEQGLCLPTNGTAARGIFPLVYSRGSTSLILAVGESNEELEALRDTFFQVLRLTHSTWV